MKAIRSAATFRTPSCAKLIPELHQGRPVGVTIGNFDALHRGHLKLFEMLREKAGPDAVLGVVSFWPHPRRVLAGVSRQELKERPEFFNVITLRQKLELLDRAGFYFCHVIHFTKQFASLTPEQFVVKHLAETFSPKVVVVGDDWAFGKGRSGNTDIMRELGQRYGFELEVVPGVSEGSMRFSTTAVKDAVRTADFSKWIQLTHRPYVISGRVRHGEKRGRQLGFPTANLEFSSLLLPPDGIYAAWANISGSRYPAAVYIGSRPTFGPGRKVVEAHLIDQTGLELYGKRADIEFKTMLRGDIRFGSREELKTAIDNDINNARAALRA